MNVVSLLPGATEILYALGVVPAGVSHECDYPPGPAGAATRPAVTSSPVAGEDCAAVNDAVAAAAADGEVVRIDENRLAACEPDLVIAQDTCDVCASDLAAVERAVDAIDADPRVLAADPHSLDGVLDDIERIGAAVGRQNAAERVLDALRSRIEAVERRTADVSDEPSVVVLDWLDPVMVAGHWIPGMVRRAGGRYPLADPGERSRVRDWTAVREADPDLLVAAPCGFPLDASSAAFDALVDRPGWDELAAVRTGRAYVADGDGHVNRAGPRLVETLEHLAGLLHPDRFPSPPTDAVLPGPGRGPTSAPGDA